VVNTKLGSSERGGEKAGILSPKKVIGGSIGMSSRSDWLDIYELSHPPFCYFCFSGGLDDMGQ
jgi:hypothetical protein